MNHAKLVVAAALVGISSLAMAADAGREQRMNDALENYRGSSAAQKNPEPGPFARAEESSKRGLHKAGSAVKRGAKKAGHAVGTGIEKTGDALRTTGEKIQGSTKPAP